MGTVTSKMGTVTSNCPQNCQRVCKPGSVLPREAECAAIPLGGGSLRPSSNQPGRRAGTRSYAAPIRSCSRWGLPCRRRYRKRGGLLPHPFDLAGPKPGGLLSVALSLGSPPPAIHRHRRSMEPGLSSSLRQGFGWQARELARHSFSEGGRPPNPLARAYILIPRSRSKSSWRRMARHSPSMVPSSSSGRKRRWKATVAANPSRTS